MIQVEITQIFNGKPYYTISKNGQESKALGYERAQEVIDSISAKPRGKPEKVEFVGVEGILQEHNKLKQSVKNRR